MNKLDIKLLLLCFLLTLSSTAYANDPWTPIKGEGSVSLSYIFETFDKFWRGTEKRDLPFGELDQHTGIMKISHGIQDDLALDLSLGYTETFGGAEGSENGLYDSEVGIRYQFMDEFSKPDSLMPTASLILKGTIPGDYEDEGFPVAPGDGAFGLETGLALGKFLGNSGFGVTAGSGYKFREGPVPNEFLFNASIFKILYEHFNVSLGFQRQQALSGIDIGSANFSPARARELKQVSNNIELGIGYTEPSSNLYFGFLYAQTLHGRNAGEKDIFALTLSYPFSL